MQGFYDLLGLRCPWQQEIELQRAAASAMGVPDQALKGLVEAARAGHTSMDEFSRAVELETLLHSARASGLAEGDLARVEILALRVRRGEAEHALLVQVATRLVEKRQRELFDYVFDSFR